MRILFMGTPDFALFSLKALYDKGENIVGVITKPDKPSGRGYNLVSPPVKLFASEKGLPVYQPQTLRGEEFASLLAKLDPELIVVVAFGKLLPENVLDYPKYGCINVHGSLLPEYRGAAPMQRAIIDGKTITGVTTMFMDVGLDTGDMLIKKEIEIGCDDNFETVHDALGKAGADALLETLKRLTDGTLVRTKQDGTRSSYAAKIEKSECLIDFSSDAVTVHNLIRGLSPVPLAYTHTPDGRLLKIVESRISDLHGNASSAGTVISTDNGIVVACGNGAIRILRLLPEGKGRMSADDFVRGRKISVGDILK